jgi:hypothetical protein
MNDIIYSLIKALLPIIVAGVVKILLDVYVKLSDRHKTLIKAVVRTAVLIAQQVYAENEDKFNYAMNYIMDKLGIEDKDEIKALINEALAELKLQWGDAWGELEGHE